MSSKFPLLSFMRKFILSLLTVCLYCSAQAVVTVIYRLEVDSVSADGVTLNQAYVNDSNPQKMWPDITVYSAVADWDNISSLSFTTGSSNTFVSELEALASDSIFVGGWVEVGLAPDPTDEFFDWSETRDFDESAEGGLSPVLFFSTSPFGSITSDDWVGLITSSGIIVPTSSPNVIEASFPGGVEAEGWDTAVLGTLGSLSLQAVPEPSQIALFLGLISFTIILFRRKDTKTKA